MWQCLIITSFATRTPSNVSGTATTCNVSGAKFSDSISAHFSADTMQTYCGQCLVRLWWNINFPVAHTLWCHQDYLYALGWDSVFGIVMHYGLNSSVIKPQWRRDFLHPSRQPLGPTLPPVQWVGGLDPGGKVAGTWHWPPTPSISGVTERVQLYFSSPSGPSQPILGWSAPFTFCCYMYNIFIWHGTTLFLKMQA